MLAFSLLGLMLASTASLVVLGQPSEAEAKSAFERLGCTVCHRSGGIGEPWEEIVSHFKASAGKYASLDDFVKAEISAEVKERLGRDARTWDELFTVMAQNVGKSRDDPGVRTVENYLASLLGFTPAPGTPTTPTPATPTPPAEVVRGEERLTWGVILAIVVIAVIVLGALVVGLIVMRH